MFAEKTTLNDPNDDAVIGREADGHVASSSLNT